MSYRLLSRGPDGCPCCIDIRTRWMHPPVSDRIPLETIVTDALELVEEHNVTPFDAADWTAAKYNYPDVEHVLQLLREVLNNK